MSSHPTAAEIRQQFLEYFREREHRVVPSGPVFPQDDPTLLFTNAGMNQFKDVFLGTGKRDYRRAVDSQKCIRVSGKHNDLEEVGRDTYHHTFFEMLGNWSFGDYFKREVIPWAWELLTDVWGLPKDRLWVTVFSGDEKDGLPVDEEAERIWRECTDIDPAHILRFDRRDNFWEMGETGPCGPCTEIHIDRGEAGSDPTDGANLEIGVNAGNERFIELWNLVFMEFNRLDDGSLQPLPAKHVDTGMGFERIASVLQGKRSNYDTDLFAPLFRRTEELCGKTYGEDEEVDVAFRVIADHVRGVSSALADGALPSNTGRGYVLRRLIRRAARYGRQQLGLEEPFLFQIVPSVAEVLGAAFPEIAQRTDHIQLLIQNEEQSFARTLGRGLVQFEQLAERTEKGGARVLPGAEAFELYATYGFPRDLVELMARERGLDVDSAGWATSEKAHQEKSRTEGKFTQLVSADELKEIEAALAEHGWETVTESTYHDEGERSHRLETDTVRLLAGDADGENSRLILRESPFYPESGGQVGDSGTITDVDGKFSMQVADVQKYGELVVHVGTWSGIAPEGSVRVVAEVDSARRDRTRRNHTATHLLHKALKEVLGDHVTQQGSYVGPDRLRFDFSHTQGMTPEQVEQVEQFVNARVIGNGDLTTTVEDLAAAKERGVTALFGEKYGDRVRVVGVADSLELCGGTHVRRAGDIGPFVLASEGAIQAGVRRIEALTGTSALEHLQEQRRQLTQAARTLKVAPADVTERIEALQKQVKEAKKKEKAGALADVGTALDQVRAALQDRGGMSAGVVDLPGLDQAALREVATRAKSLTQDLALVLFGREGERVPFLAVCQGAALENKIKAGDLARAVAGVLGGGGGGKPDMAQGQGLSADAIPQAVETVTAHFPQG